MIGYKDKTFCSSPNCKDKCGRKLTDEVKAGARKWWSHDPNNAPICVMQFCDDNGELKK